MLDAVLGTLWAILTFPFRLLAWGVDLLGRVTALAIGFTLMVLGAALWAGSLFAIGMAVFLIGLIMTLRCLG